MTPAQLDIARRLVAAPWFPKRGDGWTTRGDGNTLHFRDANGLGWVYDRLGEYVPDIADAGTGGVLLGMLSNHARGWCADDEHDSVVVTCDAYGAGWPSCRGSTLAEAAALVLLEVRGG